jgi:ketosteroid isomerase-like protein
MRSTLLVTLLCLVATAALAQTDDVLRADDAWQQAKLRADLPALSRIMADEFYEMNQNGNGRSKAETLALWEWFRIDTLTTDSVDVRVNGDTAMVTGTQTEVNGTGTDRMLFQRVYVRRGAEWRLLSSMQFRNPRFPLDLALLR